MRSGLGMGMCLPMRERRRGGVRARPGLRKEAGRDVCHLISDFLNLRAWGWARARHDKGIW